MTDTYKNNIEQRKQKENLKQAILFGQGTGLLITIIAFLNFLSTTNAVVEWIMKILMITGSALFVIGIVCPYLLYYPSKGFKLLFNKIFGCLFSILLGVIYLLLLLPVGYVNRKKWREKYGFYLWDSETKPITTKGFKERQQKENKTGEKNKIKNAIKTVGYFMERKQFVLLPILCILILLGFLFFFITSSVVTPMIYTLF